MEQMMIATQTHIVKPTSPPPLTSKIYKLSSLDQTAPPLYITLIFFYKNDESKQHEQISRRLKQSLSEILTVFYPLAGTIKQNSFIVDCNDRGAEFVEARVHARLAQFLQNPKIEELKQLVPADSSSHIVNPINLLVKTSYFDCGGVAVGVCLSHKIADAASASAFMNAWAATCRGEEASGTIHIPSFDLALRFPPRDSSPRSLLSEGITKENIVTKRLVFEREELEKLRKLEGSRNGEVKDPSRVEAVSVFIWRNFIEAYKARGTKTTSFAASHMVNLRARAVPPLPDNMFGNCFTSASAVVSSEEDVDSDEGLLLSKLRAAIRAVDDDYINQVIDKDDCDCSINEEIGGLFRSGNCAFSSWRRFPFYDVDFGWGKPVWVCTTHMPYMNGIFLMSTPCGDGIEAWINVPDDNFFQLILNNYNKLLST